MEKSNPGIEEYLDLLVASGVFETVDEDSIALTDSFQKVLDGHRERIEVTDAKYPPAGDEWPSGSAEFLDWVLHVNPPFGAVFVAVLETFPDRPLEDQVTLSLVVDIVNSPPMHTEGTPDPFMAVRGDRVPILMRIFSPAVIYVWREDCDPCDIVKDDFERIFDHGTSGIGCFSVYGPNWAELLHDSYDVVGAPTILFIRDDRIDSRLTGANYREVLEHELSMVQDA